MSRNGHGKEGKRSKHSNQLRWGTYRMRREEFQKAIAKSSHLWTTTNEEGHLGDIKRCLRTLQHQIGVNGTNCSRRHGARGDTGASEQPFASFQARFQHYSQRRWSANRRECQSIGIIRHFGRNCVNEEDRIRGEKRDGRGVGFFDAESDLSGGQCSGSLIAQLQHALT